MEKSEKLDHCLNCGHPLLNEENFCPSCGQENKDRKISIYAFVEEFISSLFNLEAVLLRTIPAFLFSPGKLTIEFNEGKRRRYIHPIRLYLIASLFYFFVLALVIPNDIVDRIISGSISKEFFEMNNTPEQRKEIKADLNSEEIKKMERIPGFKISMDKAQTDSTSLMQIAQESGIKAKETWRNLRLMAIDPEVNDIEFDSAIKVTGFKSDLDIRQQRDFIANSNFFISSAIQNLPLMMFFLLPFFAFFLWLLYLRSGTFYIENLIHGLHLHSFAYFIYGIGILWMSKVSWTSGFAGLLCFILVSVYAYFSMKKISGQGWFKTIWKFLILGMVYLIILSAAIVLELYYSLYTL